MTITPKALALLHRCKGDAEMIYVRLKDSIGYEFEGRVLTVDGNFLDVEATDGETVYACRVDRIMTVDVRPFRRFSGYGTAAFVAEVGPGVSG